jgi:single-strand DNA-binding protein
MYQEILLIGNLGRDPEMKYLPDGTAVTNFSMATSSYRKDGNATAWFRVAFFGKQAENANQYLNKGSKVMVKGELEFDASTGGPKTYAKQDGTVGVSFEVKGNVLKFLSTKGENHSDDEATGHAASAPTPRVKETEDIPF